MPSSTSSFTSEVLKTPQDVIWQFKSEDDLRNYAKQFVGMATNEMSNPENMNFQLENQFPVGEFKALQVDWEDYYRSDVRDQGGYPDFQKSSCVQFHTPVVLSLENDELILWDGFHRIATAVFRGDETIMAIVGKVKPS